MEQKQSGEPSDVLLSSVARAKRQQVSVACNRCRRRKAKCDARRPCGECTRRNLECVYSAREDETLHQAAKRKYDELSRAHDDLRELYRTLAGQREDLAHETFRRIRSGRSPASILSYIRRLNAEDPVARSYEQRARRHFVLSLVQSTAPLEEIADYAASVLNSTTRVSPPAGPVFEPLKDRIIILDGLKDALIDGSEAQATISGGSTRTAHGITDGSHDGPTFWVPAAPWTILTDNDEAVSHLISLFLAFQNSYWRYVEEDLFLKAMRSKDLSSTHCSPLLVNAVLAIASLFSEIEEAFGTPEQLFSRGEHFHQECIRLWAEEGGRACITNIQALSILVFESSARGKDSLGRDFAMSASRLNRSLAVPDLLSASERVDTTYVRVRACSAWCVAHLELSYAMALLQNAESLHMPLEALPDLEYLLPDTTVFWEGYPLKQEPIRFRANLLTRTRCQLTRFYWDVIHLLFSKDSPQLGPKLWKATKTLARRIEEWYESVPTALRLTSNTPGPILDFHGQYFQMMLTLYNRAAEIMFAAVSRSSDTESNTSTLVEPIAEARSLCLTYAHTAANCIRECRVQYGYKMAAPFLFQLATLAITIFLDGMKPRALAHASPHGELTGFSHASKGGPEGSFEECFRCLLGWSLQLTLPMGIARMIYHTAVELKVELPKTVAQMLRVVVDTAWRQSVLQRLSSIYPNWALASAQGEAADKYRMNDLLRKWEEIDIRDDEAVRESSDNEQMPN